MRPLKALLLISFLALAFAAAGCGDDGDDDTSSIAGPDPNARPEILVDIGGEPDAGPPPLTTRFTASASGADGPFLFRWSFDDGTTSTEQNPVYKFTRPGVYQAVLDVRNLEGKYVRRGAVVGVWPEREWEAGTNPAVSGPTTNQIKQRQQRQTDRIRNLHAEVAEKLRAELRAEARAQGPGSS